MALSDDLLKQGDVKMKEDPKTILVRYGESERLVSEPERRRITGISRTTWWRMEREGLTPPNRIKRGKSAWLLSDLLAWITTPAS